MPPLWCRLDRLWFPHPGILEGSITKQPFLCPLDHVFEVPFIIYLFWLNCFLLLSSLFPMRLVMWKHGTKVQYWSLTREAVWCIAICILDGPWGKHNNLKIYIF